MLQRLKLTEEELDGRVAREVDVVLRELRAERQLARVSHLAPLPRLLLASLLRKIASPSFEPLASHPLGRCGVFTGGLPTQAWQDSISTWILTLKIPPSWRPTLDDSPIRCLPRSASRPLAGFGAYTRLTSRARSGEGLDSVPSLPPSLPTPLSHDRCFPVGHLFSFCFLVWAPSGHPSSGLL